MFYDKELSFLTRILKQYNIDCSFLTFQGNYPLQNEDDIRSFVYRMLYTPKTVGILRDRMRRNVIYICRDILDCQYYALRLPDTNPEQLLLAGPYSDTAISNEHILRFTELIGASPDFAPFLNSFYSTVPPIADSHILFALFNAFGETVFQGKNNFSFENFTDSSIVNVSDMLHVHPLTEQENISFKIKRLEDTYRSENELLNIVSQGMIQQAGFFAEKMSSIEYAMEQRVPDSIRNLKNYCIILNTLLRKAAEQGFVHPFYIDQISSRYARKIELVNSMESGKHLQKEMIRKYCQLVHNHSLNRYALPVQKIMIYVDSQLSGDLSLNALADMLNMNASYLSSLFKKETGVTLTEYVNKKRIDHAILLLNSSNSQIQDIAISCGITDVNYFTKLFKRQVGKTPKDYRKMIRK